MPQPAQVLRRALFIWGWGHVTLGDRRGWLFAVIQVLAIADWLIVAVQLIDGTRWLAVFVPLVLIIVFWVGQAVHAYRRAIRLGGAPGGELQLAAFLPLVLAVFTAFWLIGGRHGSAASTVEAYMEAWESNRPDIALGLFTNVTAHQRADITDFWTTERGMLSTQLSEAVSLYGESSGLDPERPFNSVRVEQTDSAVAGELNFTVAMVRSERIESKLLGIIPTAGLQTVVIEPPLAQITVRQETVGSGLVTSSVWRVVSVWVNGGPHL